MNFKPFDKSQVDAYAAEAKAKWGKTEAYKEYENKAENNFSGGEMMDIFQRIGKIKKKQKMTG